MFPIVGIGASAGGLEAVTSLLHHLPSGPHMACVLVQHLDPTHESALTALLSRATSMPVLEARERVQLEPDHVYVIPPNKLMAISKRRLRLSPRRDSHATYTPIDHFLRSLATELARIAGHPYVAPLAEEPEPPLPVGDTPYAEILAILRQRMGVDFALYKPATLRRRIQRRLVLQKLDSLKEYAAYLRAHAAEAKDLFQDILIHVTGFFRDPHVLRTVQRKVFPRAIKGRASEDSLRIWVPGCSTGEEAYSIAITLMEFLHERKGHFPVQIFGTDINEEALDKARAGVYPDSIGADVSAERLRRCFSKAQGGYRIHKPIREMCLFARQNLVTDPPFSNLDLISCRNVLIYLGPLLQRKVLPLFHYALRPNGCLVLGGSETTGVFADLFSLVDKKARIYMRKTASVRPAVSFGLPCPEPRAAPPALPAPAVVPAPILSDLQKQADRIVLSHAAPAGVVVNRRLEVLQFRGHTGPYLEHAQSEANLGLLKMAREGLVVGLRTALTRAIKQNVPVREEGVRVRQDGGPHEVHLDVVPFRVPPSSERYYLVLFEPAAEAESGKKAGDKAARRRTAESDETRRLREELAATRESLQAIVNTVREPLVVLDAALRVQAANSAFYAAFQVAAGETLNRRIYELGNGQWDIPELRTLLEEILPKNTSFQDFEIVRDFPRLGRRRLLLNARRLVHADGKTELILLAVGDAPPEAGNPTPQVPTHKQQPRARSQ